MVIVFILWSSSKAWISSKLEPIMMEVPVSLNGFVSNMIGVHYWFILAKDFSIMNSFVAVSLMTSRFYTKD
jgi:hypothetical protein